MKINHVWTGTWQAGRAVIIDQDQDELTIRESTTDGMQDNGRLRAMMLRAAAAEADRRGLTIVTILPDYDAIDPVFVMLLRSGVTVLRGEGALWLPPDVQLDDPRIFDLIAENSPEADDVLRDALLEQETQTDD